MKKAANAARAGTLALAAFVSRPQAEAQIGANQIEIYNVIRSLSMQNVGWAEHGEAQHYAVLTRRPVRLAWPAECSATSINELSASLTACAVGNTAATSGRSNTRLVPAR